MNKHGRWFFAGFMWMWLMISVNCETLTVSACKVTTDLGLVLSTGKMWSC